ncbi:Pumilio-like 5 [Quillaja saponaria]|uniref:Pumilio-like 5 n=1 Tax=Quillaja saponaria TaxID=32244 RepID=A0AAD7LDP3_QUISA|nr:Pumilio-like 5 [Quillaja saponaria]
MATESPIRISESGGKWPSHKEAATFAAASGNMAAEELGILLKGHRFHGSERDVVPNRSGSAPPSMEGSFLAIQNLLAQQNSSMPTSLETLTRAIQNCESEEQLRADPAYLAYYCSNVNLNPRLPPPLISWEKRRLVRHIGSFSNNRGFSSVDDTSKGSLHLSRGILSTHKEESEDDHSPQQDDDNQVDKTVGIWWGQDAASLAGQHKNLVDLIQEDFPRTPSPVYSKSVSLSHGIVEEGVDQDASSSSSNDPPLTGLNTAKSSLGVDDIMIASQDEVDPTQSLSSLDRTGITLVNDSNATLIESELKALKLSNLPNFENRNYEEKWKQSSQSNLLQHQQQNNVSEVPFSKSQLISQGVNCAFDGMDQFPHNPSKFSADVQPLLQSSGFTQPLYATAAYMTSANPYYTNMQTTGLYSPEYVGGYAFNPAAIPPYIAAYPPHGAVPVVVDGTTGSSFTTQTRPGVSAGGSIPHGAELVHINKFYGQSGFPLQPSFADPFYMQYQQQPFGEGYGISGQFNSVASRGGTANQIGAFDSRKGSNTAYLEDHKFQNQRSVGQHSINPRRGELETPNYFGQPANMGILMQQYPTSPIPSPIMQGSSERRNDMRFTPGSGRNAGSFSGWQGQRGFDNTNDPKIVNFLEELKSSKGRRFELSDIIGHIVEFSADQHGSRFIQQKLESCGVDEKAAVFKEVLPHASKLMTDVFGNYVIQKFFEYGSPEQRKDLANKLAGQILPLSLQMYGCRVIQKALEVIELDQKAKLIHELDGHVIRCVRDQNGNHVIQKCIESIPTDKIGFIISAFHGQVATLSMHPYGCRVIQRVLEYCTDEIQCQFIVDEILESVCDLAQDQYGNYVTQHVLERGKPHERGQIISKLTGHIVQLSQHKFASNVVEKCLEHGNAAEREIIIAEAVGHNEGSDNLFVMMKDQFANYVVQKILEICSENQREDLLCRIRVQ